MKTLPLAFLTFCLAYALNGQIAVWNFENLTTAIPSPPVNPSSLHANLVGGWAELSGANNLGSPAACSGNETWATNFWPSAAVAQAGYYYSFRIQAKPGYALEVYSFVFSFSRSSDHSAGQFTVTVRIDGDPEIQFLSGTHSGTSCRSFGKGLNIITQSGGEVEFRVYFYGQNPAALAATVRIDDVVIGGAAPLPVELTQFRGVVFDEGITLHWITASESRNAGFHVERSHDGLTFRTIGFVPGSGDRYMPRQYAFTDERPFPGLNYYRLQQEDDDGRWTPSMIISVLSDNTYTSGIRAFPNPFREELFVQIPRGVSASGKIMLTPVWGGPAREWAVVKEQRMMLLAVEDLPPGAYLLLLRDRDRVWVARVAKH